jgi:hypothetical protein
MLSTLTPPQAQEAILRIWVAMVSSVPSGVVTESWTV